MSTLRSVLTRAEEALRAAGDPDAKWDAELLLSHVLDTDRLTLRLNANQTLTMQQEQQFSRLLLCRTQGTPLQYVLGETCFYGLTLHTDARALIPRPETELLCELGIGQLRRMKEQDLTEPKVLDLCTGSGAIALTLKHECPFAEVSACDLSTDALSLARENSRLLEQDIRFFQGDLFEAVGESRFHVILSNPPYIPAADCDALQAEVQKEPKMALDGGPDGLDFYRRIAREAPAHLFPGGFLAVEIGEAQGADVSKLFWENGFGSVSVHPDLEGHDRMVSGTLI